MSKKLYNAALNAAQRLTKTAASGGLTYEERSRLCHLASRLWGLVERLGGDNWCASSMHQFLDEAGEKHGSVLARKHLIFVRRALTALRGATAKAYPGYTHETKWVTPGWVP